MPRHRSDWRVRSDDPRSIAGWLWQDIDSPIRYVASTLYNVFLIAAVVALFRGQWTMALTLGAVPSLFGLLKRPFWINRRSLNAHITPLLTLPAPDTPFPCQVEIYRDGMLLGKDQGVATFVDNWLHYEGFRTSFSLRATDVEKEQERMLTLNEGGQLLFHPENGMAAAGFREMHLRTRFDANLASWLRSEAPEGVSVLPPLKIHASGTARAWLNLVSSLLLFAIAAALLGALTTLSTGVLLAASPLLFGVLGSLARLRRASREIEHARSLPAST